MLRFLGDLFIGWVVFTDEGKKIANVVANAGMAYAKNKLMNNINNIVPNNMISDILPTPTKEINVQQPIINRTEN